CPAIRGRARFFAHLPLPSIMIAICFGIGSFNTCSILSSIERFFRELFQKLILFNMKRSSIRVASLYSKDHNSYYKENITFWIENDTESINIIHLFTKRFYDKYLVIRIL